MTAGEKAKRFLRAALAAAAVSALAAPAVAAQYPPRRAELFDPPPLVALLDVVRVPTRAALDNPNFAVANAAPAAVLLDVELRAEPTTPDPLDLAWSLQPEEKRDLALALDAWATGGAALGAERHRLRAALATSYAARDLAPFWIEKGEWRASARAALARLALAADDGLDLRAYAAPDAEKAAPTAADELALSEAIAAYALQARGARIDPERISRLVGAKTTLPDPALAVAEVAGAGATAGDALQAYNPTHYGYQQLREKLIELRTLRAGAPASDGLYAAATVGSQSDVLPASKSKRRAAGLAKASTSRVEAEIIANMERWRWLPRDLGEERIEVNIPDFELAVVRSGEVTHRTRVIVGKEATPTPIFSNALQYIIVNPFWNVPPSILNKEMLPKANGDVAAIAANGFNVSYRGGKLVVRQPPGERNALGRIKFMFPNDFSVYLHDTPSRNLFAASHRAFSHGCMRVDAPFAFAEAVLGPGSGWSESRVRRLIGGSERYINLAKPLPIHIEYFTAYVDEGGRIVLRPDLYGYSARVRKALGLGA
ncbi:L,D-transpeptidase family protein [Methylocystis sp. H62]|uniref:L,D-transpeptidase family protein n=1 Tax=Methylocystis sp. H62 TaxID=2785789 RepID=UPI0018C2E213|nr:L,D-transpeptidase family protein [Methylocystis sp. H62]MBG0794163.1 L,D-transpeptidase family protein [Methylocystis sp. H62]